MSRPQTLYNAIRTHDQAIYDWLSGIKVDYGNISGSPLPTSSILKVFASPRRAWSSMADMLRRKGWLPAGGAGENLERVVPLPFVSIYRQGHTPSTERWSPFIFRHFRQRDSDGAWESHRHPLPIDIPYQFDFWCHKVFTMAHLMEWITAITGQIGASPNEIFIQTRHGDPWGTKIQPLRIESYTDNTDIEGSEDDYRYTRFTLDTTFQGWVFLPPQSYVPPVFFINAASTDTTLADAFSDGSDMDPFSWSTWSLFPVLKGIGGNQANQFVTSGDDVLVEALPFEITPKPRSFSGSNQEVPVRITIPSGTDWLETREFLLPEDTVAACRFNYQIESGSGNVTVELRNRAGDVCQTYQLPATGRRRFYKFETWKEVFPGDESVIMRMSADAPARLLMGSSMLILINNHLEGDYVNDGDCEDPSTTAWTAEGSAALSKELGGSNRFLRVSATGAGDGVSQVISVPEETGVYLLRVRILAITGDWNIILENADVASTYTESRAVGATGWRDASLIIQPKAGQSNVVFKALKVGAGAATIDLDDITLSETTSPIYGSGVPE